MRYATMALAAAILLSTSGGRLAAQPTVYDGGAPNGADGWGVFGPFTVTQGFTLSSLVSFDQIRFWGITNNPSDIGYTGTVNYSIFNSVGGAVGTAVFSGTSAVNSSFRAANGFHGIYDSYAYTLGFGAQSLSAGSYFLRLSGASAPLFWEKTADRTDPTLQFNGSTTVAIPDVAFQLRSTTTPVPEPVPLTLVGAGLCALAIARARRRNG